MGDKTKSKGLKLYNIGTIFFHKWSQTDTIYRFVLWPLSLAHIGAHIGTNEYSQNYDNFDKYCKLYDTKLTFALFTRFALQDGSWNFANMPFAELGIKKSSLCQFLTDAGIDLKDGKWKSNQKFNIDHEVKWVLHLLPPPPKLACFVLYVSIIFYYTPHSKMEVIWLVKRRSHDMD